MRTNNGKSKTMYGISRIDDDKNATHAWRVSLCRHGKRYVKNFPDKKWVDKATALIQATAFRDQLVLKYPPISRKDFCDTKRRNNKTGITGVYKYCKTYELRDGTVKENWYWEANWPNTVGKSVSESFAVKKYGEEIAKQMAVRARSRGLQGVEGTFWAAERGDVQLAETKISNNLFATIRALINQVA